MNQFPVNLSRLEGVSDRGPQQSPVLDCWGGEPESPRSAIFASWGDEVEGSLLIAVADVLFPVNSLFLYIEIAKTRNPCGFLRCSEKIPCYFPCYLEMCDPSVAKLENLKPKTEVQSADRKPRETVQP